MLCSNLVMFVKVDRFEFFLIGYFVFFKKFLVFGFFYGFCVSFMGEWCVFEFFNLKSVFV